MPDSGFDVGRLCRVPTQPTQYQSDETVAQVRGPVGRRDESLFAPAMLLTQLKLMLQSSLVPGVR